MLSQALEGEIAMQVMVNPMACDGHGLCLGIAPEVFAIDDGDPTAYVTVGDVPPELQEQVRKAQRSCPEGAVFIVE